MGAIASIRATDACPRSESGCSDDDVRVTGAVADGVLTVVGHEGDTVQVTAIEDGGGTLEVDAKVGGEQDGATIRLRAASVTGVALSSDCDEPPQAAVGATLPLRYELRGGGMPLVGAMDPPVTTVAALIDVSEPNIATYELPTEPGPVEFISDFTGETLVTAEVLALEDITPSLWLSSRDTQPSRLPETVQLQLTQQASGRGLCGPATAPILLRTSTPVRCMWWDRGTDVEELEAPVGVVRLSVLRPGACTVTAQLGDSGAPAEFTFEFTVA